MRIVVSNWPHERFIEYLVASAPLSTAEKTGKYPRLVDDRPPWSRPISDINEPRVVAHATPNCSANNVKAQSRGDSRTLWLDGGRWGNVIAGLGDIALDQTFDWAIGCYRIKGVLIDRGVAGEDRIAAGGREQKRFTPAFFLPFPPAPPNSRQDPTLHDGVDIISESG